MSRYLLDTDTLSNLVKRRPHAELLEKVSRQPASSLLTTTINVLELRCGCRRRGVGGDDLWQRIQGEILSRVQVLSFDARHALVAGDLLAELMDLGRLIGTEDCLIAAVALAEGIPVVTGNVRHFSRVPGLLVENWMAGGR